MLIIFYNRSMQVKQFEIKLGDYKNTTKKKSGLTPVVKPLWCCK